MKKVLFVLIIVLFTTQNVFSQENTFFVNLGSPTLQMPTLPKLGIGYEKKINNFSSYLFTADYAGYMMTIMDSSYGLEKGSQIDFLAHLRWYPFSNSLKRLFLDIGTGFSLFFITTEDTAVSLQLPIQTMIGWRFGGNKIFVQPWIGYNISFGKLNYPEYFSNEFDGLLKYGIPCLGLAVGLLF